MSDLDLHRVRVKLTRGATMPTRGTPGSAGFDLAAHAWNRAGSPHQPHPMPVAMSGGAGRVLRIYTGVSVEMPGPDWVAYVLPRSGLSQKGLHVATGVIDSDYRGEIAVTCTALADDLTIEPGQRIAQLVIQCLPLVELQQYRRWPRRCAGPTASVRRVRDGQRAKR